MKKYIGKLIFMVLVIAMSLFVAAFSCNTDFLKKLNDNLGTNLNDGGGGGGNPLPAPTATIEAHNFNNAKLTTKTDGYDTILIDADALKSTTDGIAANGTLKDVAEAGGIKIISRTHFFHLRFTIDDGFPYHLVCCSNC